VSGLHERRGAERRREDGAGPKHDLVFTDRLFVTLVHLRTGLPHAALYGIARSTISRAIGEIRPLLAKRDFATPDHPGLPHIQSPDQGPSSERLSISQDNDNTPPRLQPKARHYSSRSPASPKRASRTSRSRGQSTDSLGGQS
jgi:hypothetical protein